MINNQGLLQKVLFCLTVTLLTCLKKLSGTPTGCKLCIPVFMLRLVWMSFLGMPWFLNYYAVLPWEYDIALSF